MLGGTTVDDKGTKGQLEGIIDIILSAFRVLVNN